MKSRFWRQMGYYFNNVDIITQSGHWLSETSHNLLIRCWEVKLGAENLEQDPREFRKRGLLQFSWCYQLLDVLIISNTITAYSATVSFLTLSHIKRGNSILLLGFYFFFFFFKYAWVPLNTWSFPCSFLDCCLSGVLECKYTVCQYSKY